MTGLPRHDVTVVGQIARDLVLVVDELPEPLSSAPAAATRSSPRSRSA